MEDKIAKYHAVEEQIKRILSLKVEAKKLSNKAHTARTSATLINTNVKHLKIDSDGIEGIRALHEALSTANELRATFNEEVEKINKEFAETIAGFCALPGVQKIMEEYERYAKKHKGKHGWMEGGADGQEMTFESLFGVTIDSEDDYEVEEGEATVKNERKRKVKDEEPVIGADKAERKRKRKSMEQEGSEDEATFMDDGEDEKT